MLGLCALAQVALCQIPAYSQAWKRWFSQQFRERDANHQISADIIALLLRQAQELFPDEKINQAAVLQEFLPPKRYQYTHADRIAILMASY